MSQLAYIHSGAKTRVQKMRVGISVTTPGVPVIGATANNEGVLLGTTTTSADAVGMAIDTATYNTAQQSDNSDPSQTVSVVTNADAVWQCRLSGAATSGSALIPYFNTAASATGILVTPSATSGGSTVDMSAVDDTVIFCYSGANAGVYRRMEPADATDVNLTQAFPFAIAADDLFFVCPITEGAIQYATLTTTLDEYDALVATALNTTPTWRAVELVLNDLGNNGLLNSYVNLICADHAFAGSALA